MTSTTSIVAGGGASALIGTSGILRQDYATATTDGFGPGGFANQFQIDFAFSASVLSSASTNRIRLRGDNDSGDLITLRIDSDGVKYFNSSNTWVTGVTGAYTTNTTYYFRVTGNYTGPAGGTNGLATGSYTLGLSTDGVNYTNSSLISSFHGNTPIKTQAIESIGFESGSTGTVTVDNISVTAVPEPSTYGLMGAGALAAVAIVRRRRKDAGAA